MSALTSSSAVSNINNHHDIANINVTARIDYNLRFSKQAVLVVADNNEDYSQLARQYLVALSSQETSQANTAFISASSKLNDIQVRCRLIEQLFANALFDPEQSLAQSVLRLAQQQNDVLTVIIEHAQTLSLQIKYELCQLVQVAKKSDTIINVILFGNVESGQEVVGNKTLFKNKLVMIDAVSGQLYNYDDPKLTPIVVPVKIHLWQKGILALSVVLLMSVCFALFMYISAVDEKNLFSQSTLMADKASKQALRAKIIDSEEDNVVSDSSVKIDAETEIAAIANGKTQSTIDKFVPANASDINQALLSSFEPLNKKQVANTTEVFNALFSAPVKVNDELTTSTTVSSTKTITTSPSSSEVSITETNKSAENKTSSQQISKIDSSYYLQASKVNPQGYIIQIAGFFDEKRLFEFLATEPKIMLHHYNKILNGKKFTVVTSQNYASKAEAKTAMQLFSSDLMAREPWVKPISVVLTEINTFKE